MIHLSLDPLQQRLQTSGRGYMQMVTGTAATARSLTDPERHSCKVAAG